MPGEKPSKTKALGKTNCESNYWNILRDELVEKILLCAIERSRYILPEHKSQTYHSILQTCHRCKIVEYSRMSVFPRICLHPINVVPKTTFNGKIKARVRKITAALGLTSGLVTEIAP